MGLVCCSQLIAETKPSTAAKNVEVLKDVVTIPGLQRTRSIRLYLPPNYESTNEVYPVLYMQDGQNLFDNNTSYAGEWRIDETLNSLYDKYGFSLIVVGIDNGQETRINEYSPWENPKYGKPEGSLYVDFIVTVLKPYIDKNYRTRSEVANTGIMGSSMGGLISHYAILAYPEVFSKAGIYSPSYWFTDEVFKFTEQHSARLTPAHRIHLLGGSQEGSREMGAKMQRVHHIIDNKQPPGANIRLDVIAGGKHSESFWAEHFADTVIYLFQPDSNNNYKRREG